MNRSGLSLLGIVFSASPASATTFASASAFAVCGYGNSSSGPQSAFAYDETADLSDNNPCDYRGGAKVQSGAVGKTGTLSASFGGGGYYGAYGDWGHSLGGDLTFYSKAAVTTVTFRVTGSSQFNSSEYGDFTFSEQVALGLTGDLGSYSSGTIYANSTAREFSFSFAGAQANAHVSFTGSGSFDVSDYGTGQTSANLEILTSSGNFIGTRGFFGAVPEPTSWALMLMGLGAVGTAMRGRRSAVSFG